MKIITIFLCIALALGFNDRSCYALVRGTFGRHVNLPLGHVKPLRHGKTLCSTVQSSSPSNVAITSESTSVTTTSARVQRIKDISLQREIIKDITASEFAVRVEVKQVDAKIDFEGLVEKMDRNVAILKKRGLDNALIERSLRTKEELLQKIESLQKKTKSTVANDNESSGLPNVAVATSTTTNPAAAAAENLKELRDSLKVFVREDGTVDWDGAIASGREVAKFGTELWERLNGKDETEGLPSIGELLNPVPVAEPVTDEILRLKAIVKDAKQVLDATMKTRDDLKAKLRQARKEGNAISQDNVLTLRKLDVMVKELEKRLRLFTVDLDMERICVYLQQELESTLEPSEQRVFVAEAALIDKQLSGIMTGIKLWGNWGGVDSTMGEAGPISDLDVDELSLIDDDELSLICNEVNDLKNRLGLDSSTGTAIDWGTIGSVVSNSLNKLKEGLAFYGEGTKMLIGDIQYAWLLLIRAASGYTLKPREVNSMRRTGKDVLTLIPFTIILIIPLSPIGHVLVFSFIQRFFPDFFPSCYTEKRLNLRRLYSEIEYKQADFGDDRMNEWSLADSFKGDNFIIVWISKLFKGIKEFVISSSSTTPSSTSTSTSSSSASNSPETPSTTERNNNSS